MQIVEIEPTRRAADEPEDVEALAGLRETPLSRLEPDRVKAVAGRVKELHRRRSAVAVAAFNSGT